jgi:hypothetical protein
LSRDGADLNSCAGSEFSFTSSLAQSLENGTDSPCSADNESIDLNSQHRKVHFDGKLCVVYYEFEGNKNCRHLKSTIFWDITPCIPLKVNQCFGGTYRLHLQH